jgi:hypothetical protein
MPRSVGEILVDEVKRLRGLIYRNFPAGVVRVLSSKEDAAAIAKIIKEMDDAARRAKAAGRAEHTMPEASCPRGGK